MKRISLLFLFSLFLFLSCRYTAQNELPYRNEYHAMVHTVTEFETYYREGCMTLEMIKKHVSEWDSELEKYIVRDTLVKRSYDIVDRLGRSKEYLEMNEEGEVLHRFIFKYKGDQKRIYLRTVSEGDGVIYQTRVLKEDNPERLREVYYDEEGEKYLDCITKWFPETQESHVTEWNDKGEIEHREIKRYTGDLVYEIDMFYNYDDMQTKFIYTYNEWGDVTEVIQGEYEDGEIIESTWRRYTYEYDEQGNWTKKTGWSKGAEVPFVIATRVITYYE